MTKNGRTHTAAVRDGHDLYIYGDRATDVTSHPASGTRSPPPQHRTISIVRLRISTI